MSFAKLAAKIAQREGKKSQASVGDVREILSILADLEANWIRFQHARPDDSDRPLAILQKLVDKKRFQLNRERERQLLKTEKTKKRKAAIENAQACSTLRF